MVQALEEIVAQDLPAAFQLLGEMSNSVAQVSRLVDGMLAKVKSGEVSTDKGLSFLEVKYHMLLSYLINITYIVLRKSSGSKIECDPSIDRLVEIRTFLEKMRPIEHKLKYQIDKMVKTATTGEAHEADPSNFRPNPVNLMSKVQGSDESGSESEKEEKKTPKEKKPIGVYVPPKLAPMRYDGDETRMDREAKAQERAKMRAMGSSMMQELREEYLDTPVELSERNAAKAILTKKRSTREDYEEEYFTRLTVSKKEMYAERKLVTDASLGDALTRFSDISALTGEGGSGSKKRKAPKSSKGKGGKKKGGKKRKFH